MLPGSCECMRVDLGDFACVRAFAKGALGQLQAQHQKIKLLVNNAVEHHYRNILDDGIPLTCPSSAACHVETARQLASACSQWSLPHCKQTHTAWTRGRVGTK